jgi:hypothetical protein
VKKPVVLPTWGQCEEASETPHPTSLSTFIYDYEPAGTVGVMWRKQLAAVLDECRAEALASTGKVKA